MAISSVTSVEGDETVHHVTPSKKKKKKKGSPKMQPPMTPMIDVTFQLLLFFILTCEFRETEGVIPGTLPSKGTIAQQVSNVPMPDPITIKVIPSADPTKASYELSGVGVAISLRELGPLLVERQAKISSKEVPVLVFPYPDVPWGFVVQAFNQAKKAGFEKIGFQERME